MAELKKCPFCGGEAIDTYNTSHNYIIFCENENCMMNRNEIGFATLEKAAKEWNRRVFDMDKYEKLILADMERKHSEQQQLLSELKAVLPTTTEAEIRAKAIDEFAEKLTAISNDMFLPDNGGLFDTSYEGGYNDGVLAFSSAVEKLAEQLKGGMRNGKRCNGIFKRNRLLFF